MNACQGEKRKKLYSSVEFCPLGGAVGKKDKNRLMFEKQHLTDQANFGVAYNHEDYVKYPNAKIIQALHRLITNDQQEITDASKVEKGKKVSSTPVFFSIGKPGKKNSKMIRRPSNLLLRYVMAKNSFVAVQHVLQIQEIVKKTFRSAAEECVEKR